MSDIRPEDIVDMDKDFNPDDPMHHATRLMQHMMMAFMHSMPFTMASSAVVQLVSDEGKNFDALNKEPTEIVVMAMTGIGRPNSETGELEDSKEAAFPMTLKLTIGGPDFDAPEEAREAVKKNAEFQKYRKGMN